LSQEKWSKILSGKGAASKGFRWNSFGTEIIYTASNRSLAMAEVAVHFTVATIPKDYMMITIFIPDDTTMKIINENKYCLLRIPSVVTKGDFNILINPFHSEFSKICIINTEPFPFDTRIFR